MDRYSEKQEVVLFLPKDTPVSLKNQWLHFFPQGISCFRYYFQSHLRMLIVALVSSQRKLDRWKEPKNAKL